MGRGLRAQMKYADKIGAKFSMVIGDDDISENRAKVKNMANGEQFEVPLDEEFLNSFLEKYLENYQKSVSMSLSGGLV